MAMSDKPVPIEPANACDDETKPEIKLVAKRKPSFLFGSILDSKRTRRASYDRLTIQSAAYVNKKWQPRMETLPISTAI